MSVSPSQSQTLLCQRKLCAPVESRQAHTTERTHAPFTTNSPRARLFLLLSGPLRALRCTELRAPRNPLPSDGLGETQSPDPTSLGSGWVGCYVPGPPEYVHHVQDLLGFFILFLSRVFSLFVYWPYRSREKNEHQTPRSLSLPERNPAMPKLTGRAAGPAVSCSLHGPQSGPGLSEGQRPWLSFEEEVGEGGAHASSLMTMSSRPPIVFQQKEHPA